MLSRKANWGDQLIVAYKKPPRRPVWMSKSEYEQCDDFILVRHVSYEVKRKLFSVKRIIIATTMLDAAEFTVEDLAELYCKRWQVELDIRSLKTHMQMDHLRCESPAMVRKEIYAHLIAYNLIRDLIVNTSIMEHTVGDRKPRVHPREIKRRPKSYKLMQKPRHAARKLVAQIIYVLITRHSGQTPFQTEPNAIWPIGSQGKICIHLLSPFAGRRV
jgi:hypothetical protein